MVGILKLSPYRLMDRTLDCGSRNRGSIPRGGANHHPCLYLELRGIFLLVLFTSNLNEGVKDGCSKKSDRWFNKSQKD